MIDLVESEDYGGEYADSDYAEGPGKLESGTHLNPWESRLAIADKDYPEERRGGTSKRRSIVKLEKKTKKKSRTSVLLAAAEQQEGKQRDGRKRKKKGRSGSRNTAAKALVRLLQSKSSQKRKHGHGSDPSDGGDSSEDSSEEEEDSSESDVMAPLKKRAHRKPGSILKMLIDHAKDAMDQSSVIGVEDHAPVTQGIKMSSYFNLLVRPYFSASSRDMKEMHLLSITLDLLRSGQLKQLGDALSARFLALHCAATEGTWAAAKHLELYPLEQTQSAPMEVLLQARKHARVVMKSQGIEESAWRRKGGGDSSGWRNYEWQESKGGKGKGGKGKHGKGKGKNRGGGWNQQDDWQSWGDKKNNWWRDQKDNKDGKEKQTEKDGKKDK